MWFLPALALLMLLAASVAEGSGAKGKSSRQAIQNCRFYFPTNVFFPLHIDSSSECGIMSRKAR